MQCSCIITQRSFTLSVVMQLRLYTVRKHDVYIEFDKKEIVQYVRNYADLYTFRLVGQY